jgi:hypothetical protein
MATTVLVRSLKQRACRSLGSAVSRPERFSRSRGNVAVRVALPESRVSQADKREQLPWEDLSLNTNAVYVNDKEEEGTEPTTSGKGSSSSSSSHTFGCDLHENLFHVNVGKAITTLRDELPLVLEQELSYDIYTEDVAFVDEISPKLRRKAKTAVGKESYKNRAWSIRFHTWLFFYRASFEVLNIWQPEEDRICVRWSFRGLPRIIGTTFPDTTTNIDGVSEFKLNRQGLIYEHKVDNMDINSQFKLQDLGSLLSLNTNNQGSWPTPSYFK